MILLDPPSDILASFLYSSGIVTDPLLSSPWPVFSSSMPDEPGDCVSIQDTFGKLEGRYQATGETVTKPGIQVRIRSGKYNNAYSIAGQLSKALDDVFKQTVELIATGNTYVLQAVNKTSDPIYIGRDDKRQRFLFVLNAYLTIEAP